MSILLLECGFHGEFDALHMDLQDECKRVSTEGQNLRLDLSAKFQDAIKVHYFFGFSCHATFLCKERSKQRKRISRLMCFFSRFNIAYLSLSVGVR